MTSKLPIFEMIASNYHNFNSASLKHALIDYNAHIRKGGAMFWSVAGAMSTARLGISLAPAIRHGLVHGISTTGANLEESLVRLLSHSKYKNEYNYRFLSRSDDEKILTDGYARVTDTLIPESAFSKVKALLMPRWIEANKRNERRFWHEHFYELVADARIRSHFDGDPAECWLLAAAEMNIPIIVGGYADSSFGNIFAAECYKGNLSPTIIKSDIEYMMSFYDIYRKVLSKGPGAGFFQVGGGIAGDFPICVVPSIRQDLGEAANQWAYFCQVGDSTTSYGSYSGAPPNEKITWDKLSKETPMHMIESDATIVVPIMLQALIEAAAHPMELDALLTKHIALQNRR